jgi:hypothetical protein
MAVINIYVKVLYGHKSSNQLGKFLRVPIAELYGKTIFSLLPTWLAHATPQIRLGPPLQSMTFIIISCLIISFILFPVFNMKIY